MAAVEFLNFLCELIIALIVIRGVQILGSGTWISTALGAIHS